VRSTTLQTLVLDFCASETWPHTQSHNTHKLICDYSVSTKSKRTKPNQTGNSFSNTTASDVTLHAVFMFLSLYLLSVLHSFVFLCIVFCVCFCTLILTVLPFWHIKERRRRKNNQATHWSLLLLTPRTLTLKRNLPISNTAVHFNGLSETRIETNTKGMFTCFSVKLTASVYTPLNMS